MSQAVNKILVVNLDRIGDVLRMTPLLRKIKQQYPQSYLAVLAVSPALEVLRYNPYVDELWSLPSKAFAQGFEQKLDLQVLFEQHVSPMLSTLAAQEFDLMINPYSEWAALASLVIKPKRIIGRTLDREGRFTVVGKQAQRFYQLFTQRGSAHKPSPLRVSEAYMHIFKDLDEHADLSSMDLDLYLSASDHNAAENFLNAHQVSSEDFLLVIQVGAMGAGKMWPLEHFVQLVRSVQKFPQIKVVLSGSKSEAQHLIPRLLSRLEAPVIVSAGELSLLESAALLSRANLLVTNDTGPMHLADALNIPILALFAQDFGCYYESRPLSKQSLIVFQKSLPDILPEEVSALIEQISQGVQLPLSDAQSYGQKPGVYLNEHLEKCLKTIIFS